MNSNTLDHKDQKLLSLLSDDARLPVAVLARELHLSRTAVRHRIEKLERHGIITGYTLKVGNINPTCVQAMATVSLLSGSSKDLKQRLKNLTATKKIWIAAGHIDAFVLLESATIKELYDAINFIGTMDIVTRMNSHIILDKPIDR
ncbi:Lrp/AsnC family transcriptional regulator [Motiliproteus sp. MSK22-1]|uniref:Lrp/AsnC family transcriptional regulator n=1 Tax=Motiliproteus sp. MSK22-1 TaxID=1897630 RepID=UPI0009779F91|nr:Lrp/AsnC family transcriptional regulator [Motiliproteus sp. MSK22-1]OMH25641.1 hypothetical protein BGP75_24150 [Motiliproteus sp. MSK22-1]